VSGSDLSASILDRATKIANRRSASKMEWPSYTAPFPLTTTLYLITNGFAAVRKGKNADMPEDRPIEPPAHILLTQRQPPEKSMGEAGSNE
jgi:hypothetical protein